MSRVLGLDHGASMCGCAVADPSLTIVTPLPPIPRPESPSGLDAIVRVTREQQAVRVVVGLPLTLEGEEGPQARAARAFAGRVARVTGLPVEMQDERFTTLLAERGGGREHLDSRAAAHMLESWLAAQPTA